MRRFLLIILLVLMIPSIYLIGMINGRYHEYPSVQIVRFAKEIGAQFKRIFKSDRSNKPAFIHTLNESPERDKIIKIIKTNRSQLKYRKYTRDRKLNIESGAGGFTEIENGFLILDRVGNVFRFDEAGYSASAIPSLPNNVGSVSATNFRVPPEQFRAHSITFDYQSRFLFASYERQLMTGETCFVISRIKLDERSHPESKMWDDVFVSEPMRTFDLAGGGGKLLIDGDNLYFGVGAYADVDYPNNDRDVQHPDSSKGKIFQLDIKTLKLERVSIGHRNIQGINVIGGRIFSTEHGPQGGDELNLIQKGGNYGWPFITYGTQYGNYSWKNLSIPIEQKFIPPLFAWVPSIGITQVIPAKNLFGDKNSVIVTSLKSQSIFLLFIEDDIVRYVEQIYIGDRIRDALAVGTKDVALLTDNLDIIFLQPDSYIDTDKEYPGYPETIKLEKCLVCHHFGPTNPSHLAPSLSGLIGRPIASDNYANYSDALQKGIGKIWTPESVKLFLENSDLLFPGTTMPKQNLDKTQSSEIVDELMKAGGL